MEHGVFDIDVDILSISACGMVLVLTAVLRRLQIAIKASFLQGALANGRKSPFLQSFFLEIHLSQSMATIFTILANGGLFGG